MTEQAEGLRTKQARPPANEIDDDDNTSQLKYKKISKWFTKETIGNNDNNSNRIKSKHKCFCSTCLTVGVDLLQRKYIDFNNILIEDDSKLIFNLF